MEANDSTVLESIVATTTPQSAGLHAWPVYRAIDRSVRTTVHRLAEAGA